MKMEYKLKEDVNAAIDIKNLDIDDFCSACNISRRTLFNAFSHTPSKKILESIYSYIYSLGIRLNNSKAELYIENKKQNEVILYHGSKYGINNLEFNGSRADCDFGKGLYLTPSLNSAISFVNASSDSSIYAFKINLTDLKVYEFECDLDWMLLISLYRGKIETYKNHKLIKNILNKITSSDILIGPIADNKMFEVMSKFSNGEITTLEALHSLSASRLGKQVVIKSEKALKELKFLNRFYLCEKEKELSLNDAKEQEALIQSKLDFAKREFRGQGQYIDEVFK